MPKQSKQSPYERSVAIMRNAIPRMSELRIPITPSNYAVWYGYLSEEVPDLRAEMDELLKRGQSLSDGEMAALYDRFLSRSGQTVEKAKQALSQVVNVLMNQISHADDHFNAFSSEFQQVADGLAQELSPEEFAGLMDRAVSATNDALQHGADMRQKFSDLAGDMDQLRAELARSQQEARSDALTGLYNRLAFQEELDRLREYAESDMHVPCLLLVDIDFFKRVNDTYGHLGGDVVLQGVARLMKEAIKGRDVVARYGGEEFAILFRDTPRSGCLAAAENLRRHITAHPIPLPEEMGFDQPVRVTVSVGVAAYRKDESVEGFVERADRALYRSKENGRDRVSWEDG